jgi:hypothetical protein
MGSLIHLFPFIQLPFCVPDYRDTRHNENRYVNTSSSTGGKWIISPQTFNCPKELN